MKNIVFLTGAGMSAESGISTFRDSNGLWENHDIMDVASPIGWAKNPKLVLDFYNARRAQLRKVKPNIGHHLIKALEGTYTVHIVTQNVDNLHEKAKSSNILHLHGELTKIRSTKDESLVFEHKEDLNIGDFCPKGSQLRPHIVWFGEAVPMLDIAIEICKTADILVIIGTSLAVYPAAGLLQYAPSDCPIYYIDPNPASNWELENSKDVTIIKKGSSDGMNDLLQILNITTT